MTSTELRPGERIKSVRCTRDNLVVDLVDGRSVSVPFAWFPSLVAASPKQRSHWCLSGAGYGIHWPELDEDLSVDGLLRGAPASRGSAVGATTAR
jgi:hypothetical protein